METQELMSELVMLRTLLIAAVREHGPIKLSMDRWMDADHGDWALQVTQDATHINVNAIVMGQVVEAA